MPYTSEERRAAVRQNLDAVISQINSYPDSDWDGELNYAISYLVGRTMAPFGKWRYHFLARAVAVFECAKLEFYRRLAAPYEDKAILKNGDIGPYEQQ